VVQTVPVAQHRLEALWVPSVLVGQGYLDFHWHLVDQGLLYLHFALENLGCQEPLADPGLQLVPKDPLVQLGLLDLLDQADQWHLQK